MSRFQNNLLFLLCAILVSSCGFIDLRQIGISVEPNINDSVLPQAYSPVILKFDARMIKSDAENIIQISSDLGAMRGDTYWEENHLYFVPVSGWTPGVRYTLSLMGNIRAADGREMRLSHFVSFYAVNKNSPPLLERHSPAAGASIGTNNVVLEFEFSRSMNRLSVESALNIEGIGNKTFEWSNGDKKLKVIPDRALSPWTMYRWTLRDTGRSEDGVPLPGSFSGYFITDLDQTLPKVTRVFPVLFSGGAWHPTGADIETGLGAGEGIAVEFNKPMGENVLRSLRFEPSLTGRVEFLSEESVVYILTRYPDPQTTYTLTVSSDAKDREGLGIGSDFKINFSPDIPFLKILFFAAGENIYSAETMTDNVILIRVDPGTGEFFFSLHFSLLFNLEEKLNAAQRITLSPFFPRTLAPAALQYVNWTSGDRLFMRWEGLAPSENEPHYYRLTIPGGRGGISSDTGIFMKEDINLYLEAVR